MTTTTMKQLAILTVACLSALPKVALAQLCEATCDYAGVCVFNVNVDLHEGQLGYFVFDECSDEVSPTLAMEVGVTYKFVQAGVYNYFHPMGFAYYADGAHDDQDELEPGIAPPGTNSSCKDTLSCPAPMYFLNDAYLGTYSNLPGQETQGEDNFGLDDYEPRFFWPFTEWLEQGNFSVSLLFTEQDFAQDIFYFCHIHQFMTGRIKLMKNGVPVQEANLPEIPYAYDKPTSDYDHNCGTIGLEDYQLPYPECPDRFICGLEAQQQARQESDRLTVFGDCIDAMNCRMIADMTTGVAAESEVALFMHQMIPHHENAIHMAKALLKSGDLDDCTDLRSQEPKCLMFDIAISIVNGQNFQIQLMRTLLNNMGYPATDDCTVPISSSDLLL